MTSYVLDTDTLTLFQENHPAVVRQVANHPPADVAITVLSVEEQLSGWYTRLRRAKDLDELAAVYERMTATAASLGRFQVLSFTKPAILRFQQLHALKLGVSKMDLRIAAVTRRSSARETSSLAWFKSRPHRVAHGVCTIRAERRSSRKLLI
jgi:tRNA(fMet)-specific endonuclease VapC